MCWVLFGGMWYGIWCSILCDTHTHTRTYTHTDEYIHAHTHTHIHTHTHTSIHAHAHTVFIWDGFQQYAITTDRKLNKKNSNYTTTTATTKIAPIIIIIIIIFSICFSIVNTLTFIFVTFFLLYINDKSELAMSVMCITHTSCTS